LVSPTSYQKCTGGSLQKQQQKVREVDHLSHAEIKLGEFECICENSTSREYASALPTVA